MYDAIFPGDAKRDVIERAGARGITRYAYGGSVNVGFGCGTPDYTDDIHVNEYLLAIVSHSRPSRTGNFPIDALLCSSKKRMRTAKRV
jgi:hypothetical protein